MWRAQLHARLQNQLQLPHAKSTCRCCYHSLPELYNVEVTFDPKPIPGDWNGAGGHTNYSTKSTRTAGTGWQAIQDQIAKLEKRHAVHIAAYGEGNERRLTGGCWPLLHAGHVGRPGISQFAAVEASLL
jgi:glutamine synthetase